MAKRSRPTLPPTEADAPQANTGKARRRVKRLERELRELRATETKRRKQLGEVQARAADVRTRLATVRAVVASAVPAADSDASDSRPIGYCLRDKRTVQVDKPKPVTLSNGRAAIAGTCSICGARVMVLSARAGAPTA